MVNAEQSSLRISSGSASYLDGFGDILTQRRRPPQRRRALLCPCPSVCLVSMLSDTFEDDARELRLELEIGKIACWRSRVSRAAPAHQCWRAELISEQAGKQASRNRD